MLLKNYQKDILSEINNYLNFLDETQDSAQAYNKHWDSKGYRVGSSNKDIGVRPYRKNFGNAPDICLKVPTGGGKTFIACCALKQIFDHFPEKIRFVLWLVPSTAILDQTKNNLKDPYHPYRQKLNSDFGSKVEVYDIEELLTGQSFNETTVRDQLSICVLSYASTKSNNPDNRRIYRQNGYLQSFNNSLNNLENVSDQRPSLSDVIKSLHPIIVLDESHNAGTKLARDAIKQFEPVMLLELTATPTKESNIITIIKAKELKKEEMVKLPILLYGRPDVETVLFNTIDFRRKLEEFAKKEERETGRYLRPIALIQAQPKNDADSVTFDKIKKDLVTIGIPEEHIAIKVSGKDELKGVDLLSKTCPIRYIITVNALKEGWDCPFAYILSTIARRSSQVEVEQIVGRILRQPGGQRYKENLLNASYVITSSKVFTDTLTEVSTSLINMGFSKRDYRKIENSTLDQYTPGESTDTGSPEAPSSPDENNGDEDEIDTKRVKDWIDGPNNSESGSQESTTGPGIDTGEESTNNPPEVVNGSADGSDIPETINPDDTRDEVNDYGEGENESEEDDGGFGRFMRKSAMKKEFINDVKNTKLPKFMCMCDDIFMKGQWTVLTKGMLSDNFKISDCDRKIDFELTSSEMGFMDVSEDESTLSFKQATDRERSKINRTFKEITSKNDASVKKLMESIFKYVNKIDCVEDSDLKKYLSQVFESMSLEELNKINQNPSNAARIIKFKVESEMGKYQKSQFTERIKVNEIRCRLDDPSGLYKFPEIIDPHNALSAPPYAKSLYEDYNNVKLFERSVLDIIDSCENVLWWHRPYPRGKNEFFLNGFIHHYPDFIVKTKSGVVVLVESKGEQLNNEDSANKRYLGEEWEKLAGSSNYKYYMVFSNEHNKPEGSISMAELKSYLSRL